MSTVKRLLLVGGGYAEIPIIRAAKRLGFQVFTSGNRPEQLGHALADGYHSADFSDREAVLMLAEQLQVDSVCSCCNDFSAISCAYVAEKMGLAGHDPYETSLLIHHKDRYRKFALENQVLTPRAVSADRPEDALREASSLEFPLIVKPVDLSGGKGISVVRDLMQLASAVEKALRLSKARRVVIEEFKEGSRHGFTSFLVSGKVAFSFSDDEFYFKNPFMVAGTHTPGTLPETTHRALCFETERIASLLGLQSGIFHVQLVLQGDQAYIIEICRRPPGDLYLDFVKHATGIDYAELHVRASAGMDCSGLSLSSRDSFVARYCLMAERNGRVGALEINPALQHNIIEEIVWGRVGNEIQDFLVDKLGIVFLRFESKEEMLEKSKRFYQLYKLKLEVENEIAR